MEYLKLHSFVSALLYKQDIKTIINFIFPSVKFLSLLSATLVRHANGHLAICYAYIDILDLECQRHASKAHCFFAASDVSIVFSLFANTQVPRKNMT